MRRNSDKKYNDFIDLMLNAGKDKDSTRDDTGAHVAFHAIGDEGNNSLVSGKPNIKNLTNTPLTEDEMVAQGLVFIVAGYEGPTNTLAFCTYELAVNPSAQSRLYEEIVASQDSDGEVDGDALARLPFMDAVVAETLRLHPPSVKLWRSASEDYALGDTGITIRKGQKLELSVYGIHRSEEYYANADTFIPDRFLPENRHTIQPYTYLPFGAGPRNCIGMRFALMEVKLALFHIIKKYELVRVPQTQVPLKSTKFKRANSTTSVVIGVKYRI
ncbi:unnamed protein product, partial [Oppiella nova]